jgi:hypothetical protein
MPTMPNSSASSRPLVPVLIESGSCSKCFKNRLKLRHLILKIFHSFLFFQIETFLGSHEQSPRLFDSFHYESTDTEVISGPDSQLREDLADAMRDCPALPLANRDSGKSKIDNSLAVRFLLS